MAVLLPNRVSRTRTRVAPCAAALLVSGALAAAGAPLHAQSFPADAEIQEMIEARVASGGAVGIALGVVEADGTTRTYLDRELATRIPTTADEAVRRRISLHSRNPMNATVTAEPRTSRRLGSHDPATSRKFRTFWGLLIELTHRPRPRVSPIASAERKAAMP